MAARLLEGERALLTETVGGPMHVGLITEAPSWGPVFTDLRGVEEETLRLIGQAEASGDPLGQLARLRDLHRRVRESIEAGPVWWDAELHGPTYEAFEAPVR